MTHLLPARTPIVNPILWLDLETTGLSHLHDEILSLGVVLTDSNLVEYARAEWTLAVTPEIERAMLAAPQVVWDMHRASGLIQRMNESTHRLSDVVTDLHELLDTWLGGQLAVLGGSSPFFDYEFVRENATSLLRHLDRDGRRMFDVSGLRLLGTMWGVPKFEAPRAHTPLADLDRTLAEFRHYRWELLRLDRVPLPLRYADNVARGSMPPPR